MLGSFTTSATLIRRANTPRQYATLIVTARKFHNFRYATLIVTARKFHNFRYANTPRQYATLIVTARKFYNFRYAATCAGDEQEKRKPHGCCRGVSLTFKETVIVLLLAIRCRLRSEADP